VAYLLDINVLIARTDALHVLHSRTVDWMKHTDSAEFATCPITENGFLRIYGHPDYPRGPGSPNAALPLLRVIKGRPGHRFLPANVALDDTALFTSLAGMTSRQLTDVYLLGLAVRHQVRFVTFDARIASGCVRGGSGALEVITT